LVSFRRLVASQLQTYWNQWPLCYPAACGGPGGVLTEEILRSRAGKHSGSPGGEKRPKLKTLDPRPIHIVGPPAGPDPSPK